MWSKPTKDKSGPICQEQECWRPASGLTGDRESLFFLPNPTHSFPDDMSCFGTNRRYSKSHWYVRSWTVEFGKAEKSAHRACHRCAHRHMLYVVMWLKSEWTMSNCPMQCSVELRTVECSRQRLFSWFCCNADIQLTLLPLCRVCYCCKLSPMHSFCATDDIGVMLCHNWVMMGVFISCWHNYISRNTIDIYWKGIGFFSFPYARRFNKYFDWITEGGFKRRPQTGQSICPSRLRVRILQGLLVEVVVVLARMLERRLRRREASSWSSSSMRETEARRGKALPEPICLASSGFILAISIWRSEYLNGGICWGTCVKQWCEVRAIDDWGANQMELVLNSSSLLQVDSPTPF